MRRALTFVALAVAAIPLAIGAQTGQELFQNFNQQMQGESDSRTTQSKLASNQDESSEIPADFRETVTKHLGSRPDKETLSDLWKHVARRGKSDELAKNRKKMPEIRFKIPERVRVPEHTLPTVENFPFRGNLGAALRRLGQQYNYSIKAGQYVDLTQNVQFNINSNRLDKAVGIILSSTGYEYIIEDGTIAIKGRISRKIRLHWYPTTIEYESQIGQGGGQAGGGQGGSGGGGIASGQSELTTTVDNLQVWTGIERLIDDTLSEDGEYTLSQELGVAILRGRPDRVRGIIKTLGQEMQSQLGQYVRITTNFVEVSFSNQRNFGVDWQKAISTASGGDQITANFEAGLGFQSSGGGNVSFTVSSDNSEGIIRALDQQGDVRSRSQPTIVVANRHNSQVVLDETQRFISTVRQAVGSQSDVVSQAPEQETISEGISVAYTPTILDNDLAFLLMTPMIQEIRSIEEKNPVEGITIQQPTQTRRLFNTSVAIRPDELLIVGGLMSRRVQNQDRRVPGAASIPYLGALFRGESREAERTELVLLTDIDIIRRPFRLDVSTL